jgi:glycosyltransferase 2 family protein
MSEESLAILKKKSTHLFISLGLTLLIGYLIYRSVPNWGQAWKVMIQGHPLFLLAGFSCTMTHMILRAARWGVLLAPVKRKIHFKNLFSLTLIKYVINVIPPRAGEVVASVLLARKEEISAVSVVAASLLERLLDLLTVVVLFGFYLSFFGDLYAPNSDRGRAIMRIIQAYSLKGFIVLCLALVFLFLSLRHQKWVQWLPASVQRHLVPFLHGFHAIQQGKALVKVVFLSAAIWLVITCQLWFLMEAYLDHFPFIGALFITAITVVGVAIPTPGGVGGFQFFMNLALVNFFAQFLSAQDPNSQAAGISNGCYLASMVPAILIGLVLMNREGLSFKKVSQFAAEAPAEE